MRSIAQVSEHTTHASPRRPSAMGRKPCGSRTATRRSRVRNSRENAPWARVTASTRASSTRAAFDRANRCRKTSVSLDVWKMAPCPLSHACSSRSLTRFPLWQTAMGPWTHSIRIGWALTSVLSPAVEYRTWPMAAEPCRSASARSLKMSAT